MFCQFFTYHINQGKKSNDKYTMKKIVSENGASTNPCSQTYPGPRPLSEPETQALAEFIKSFDNIKVYLSFHSYGQMLLYPYVSE